MEVVALVAVTVLLGGIVVLLTLWGRKAKEGAEPSAEQANGKAVPEKQPAKKQKPQRPRKEKAQPHTFSHPLLASALKAHSGSITCLDFSSNGKYLASCSDDRTVRIWSTKDFLEKEHRCMRANVDLDHATYVRFSPDCRTFIVFLANGDTIRVFKMTKKDDAFIFSAHEDFQKNHKAIVINIGIAETGKFIMTASNDTTILIWNRKGDVLATINTNQVANAYASVSPCGRFVASCGFTPDVKVWEVCFGKSGEFREVSRAFELKGHSAGVCGFAFSNDSSRMASVSKDGTWKLWKTDVEYKKQQDPYLLLTGKWSGKEPCRIALSPDGRTVAIASVCDITVYNSQTGAIEEEFKSVHAAVISALAFDINNRFLVSTGDRVIRVFHNSAGYRASIADMKEMLKKANTKGTKDRLQQQIKDAQKALDAIYKQ
ncbi:transducin beta-like protein 2 [Bufo gargarizans]|uniref:transducin beta-like protein 2 n=1 Tax=Bufo gargarizans TaxID=30331 RepID=UPI001CF1ED90|nr:transducin beta-like protein 2 [Bufo gargarizans]